MPQNIRYALIFLSALAVITGILILPLYFLASSAALKEERNQLANTLQSFSIDNKSSQTSWLYGKNELGKSAILHLYPIENTFRVGETFTSHLLIDAPHYAINSAGGEIFFPPDKLEVLNVSTENSKFTLWVISPEYSNEDGIIRFAGGLPTPGFAGNDGVIMEIIFRVKRSGKAELAAKNVEVLANNGSGTDIFKEFRGVSYHLVGDTHQNIEELLNLYKYFWR